MPEPLLEPLRIVTYIPSASGRTYSTRRIPSRWEASETRLHRCGSCRGIGHNKASIKCPVNIRNLRAEFGIKPTTQPSPEPLPSLSPSPESAIQPDPELVDTRPIWPHRPELIYRRYIDEKEDWLRAHPDVQPAQYRTARGLEQYSKAWLNENRRYLGFRRLDLETETFLEGRAKWTDEEIEAYLDWDIQETIKVEIQEEAKFNRHRGFSREHSVQGLYNQAAAEVQAQECYKFTTWQVV